MAAGGILTDNTVLRHSKRKVFYYYDESVGNYHYGIGHPMKPQRIRLTHEIIQKYGMLRRLHVYRPTPLPFAEISNFHHPAYLRYLQGVSGDLKLGWKHRFSERFNIGEDCPPFDGCYDFSTLCAGGSVAAAKRLISGDCDIAINWAGGLHHAKKSEASGFCYINDAVLAIQELLTVFNRVLYIDIDIHHGDGVEEAFFTTNRVFTLSLHKYGDFFPGTGALFDIGADKGKYHTMNVPLEEGINDEDYEELFTVISSKINEYYKPDVIVMQCGADSLAGDRIGVFNLTTKGHGGCVDWILKLNLPTLILGGGGYTVRNVSRCWTYETAVALDEKDSITDNLPFNSYYEDFGPDFKLHTKPLNWRNKNSKETLSRMKAKLFEHMRKMTLYKQPQYENGVKVRPVRRFVHTQSGSSLTNDSDTSFPAVDTIDAEAYMSDTADPDIRISDVERNRFREPLEDIADRAETGYSELDDGTGVTPTRGRLPSGDATAQNRRRGSHSTLTSPLHTAAVTVAVAGSSRGMPSSSPPAVAVTQEQQQQYDLDQITEEIDDDDDEEASNDAERMITDDAEAEADVELEDDDEEEQVPRLQVNVAIKPSARPRMSLMTDYRRLQERMSDADEDDVINPPTAATSASATVADNGSTPLADRSHVINQQIVPPVRDGPPSAATSPRAAPHLSPRSSADISTGRFPSLSEPPVDNSDNTTSLLDTVPTSSALSPATALSQRSTFSIPTSSSSESTPSSSVQMSSRRSRRIASRSSRTPSGSEQ